MAAAMAIADDADAAHGPLELLFTVQEETGMYGAFALKPDFISGRWLLNLDTEEEAAIYVGCAGGGDVRSIFDIRSQARSEGKKCIRIQITGLAGGHSGLDIHLNRANAIKCLARILYAIDRAKLEFQICNIQGGTMRNAIPREASCDACIDSNQLTALREIVNNISSELTSEFAATDPDLLIYCDVRPQCQCQQNFTPEFTSQLILSLVANPSGVGSMSRDVEGLVETSNNLGVIRTHSDKIEVVNCTRSTNAIALEALRQSIAAIHRLAGATVSLEPSYPGWQPKMDSPLLKIALDTHQNLFGPAKIKAVHAGLECGLIGQIYPQLDMISIGPTIKGAHSPAERVSISSTQKFYSHLKQLLANIP
jgi:dipeptidase D